MAVAETQSPHLDPGFSRRHAASRTTEGTQMTNDLAGTTALVTGATSGIGRATAVGLAKSGAYVVITGRDPERGAKAVADIRADGGTADFVAADLSDVASVRRLAGEATSLGGGHVDILVNNAGVFSFGPTDQASEDDFEQMYNTNVRAPFFLVAALAPGMAARGHGSIVNITTMVAEFGAPQMALYGSTKAALVLLTKSWAAEYGPSGVRFNAVSPGPTRTEGTAPMGDGLDQLAATTPTGRPALPEEIASAVVYLASNEASFVQGALLSVDGGRAAV
jgi:NAD(P)-dependent dehydrogenase (short-subunit alcohol dehydrogenase family)